MRGVERRDSLRPCGACRKALQCLRAELHIRKFNARVVPEDAKEESLEFQNLLAGNIVVDFKEGIMSPVLLGLIVVPDPPSDSRPSFFGNAADAYIRNFVYFLVSLRFYLLIENINSARNMRNGFPIASFNIEAASFDES